MACTCAGTNRCNGTSPRIGTMRWRIIWPAVEGAGEGQDLGDGGGELAGDDTLRRAVRRVVLYLIQHEHVERIVAVLGDICAQGHAARRTPPACLHHPAVREEGDRPVRGVPAGDPS